MQRSDVAARPAPKRKSKRAQSDGTVFGIVLSLGLLTGGAILLWYQVIPNTKAVLQRLFYYERGTCRILDKDLKTVVQKHEDDDGRTYETTMYKLNFMIVYEAGGESYRTWAYDGTSEFRSGDGFNLYEYRRFEVGKEYPCWYDPEVPRRVVVQRGLSWSLLLGLIPVLMIVVGAIIAYILISHLVVWFRRLVLGTAGEVKRPVVSGLTLPDCSSIHGTQLKYGYGVKKTGWGCLSLLAVFFFVPLLMEVDHLQYMVRANAYGICTLEDMMWALLLLATAAGVGYFAVRMFMTRLRVGPTAVEASEPWLYPGCPVEMLIRQSGNVRIARLKVTVCCSERAEYVEGTRTRHFSSEIFKGILADLQDVTVRPGRPHDIRIRVTLPRNAMHSFDAGNNEVRWELTVNGEIDKWPDFKRSFTLPVLPVPLQEPAA